MRALRLLTALGLTAGAVVHANNLADQTVDKPGPGDPPIDGSGAHRSHEYPKHHRPHPPIMTPETHHPFEIEERDAIERDTASEDLPEDGWTQWACARGAQWACNYRDINKRDDLDDSTDASKPPERPGHRYCPPLCGNEKRD